MKRILSLIVVLLYLIDLECNEKDAYEFDLETVGQEELNFLSQNQLFVSDRGIRKSGPPVFCLDCAARQPNDALFGN